MNTPNVDIAIFRDSMPNKIINKNVIIIDTHNFTTTAIEALSNGAKEIIPLTSMKGGLPSRITMIAGDENENIQNHPKYMKNVTDEIIGINSWNGSSCVHEVRGLINGENVNVYLASLTNAPIVAKKLKNQSKDILFVLAGSDGNSSPEDILTMQCIYTCIHANDSSINSVIKFYEQSYDLNVTKIYNILYEDKNKLKEFGKPIKHATEEAKMIGTKNIIPIMNNNGGFYI